MSRRPRLVGRDLVRRAHAHCRELRKAGVSVSPTRMLRAKIHVRSRSMRRIFVMLALRIGHPLFRP